MIRIEWESMILQIYDKDKAVYKMLLHLRTHQPTRMEWELMIIQIYGEDNAVCKMLLHLKGHR